MFRLSQKADYGLILLSACARAGRDKSVKFISVSSIAQKHKISPKFLSQIAQELKKSGMITAREGVSGGYTLAKAPNQIKIVEVLKILEGGLVEGKCFENDHECTCGAGDMWRQMKDQMMEMLGKKTVADLVRSI